MGLIWFSFQYLRYVTLFIIDAYKNVTEFVIKLVKFLSSKFPVPFGQVDLWILRSLSRFSTFVESTLMKLRFCFEQVVGNSVF